MEQIDLFHASLVTCHVNLVATLHTGQETCFVKKTVGIGALTHG